MGLFRDLGRRAEKLKQEASAAADAQADYACADCGKAIFTERETCPDCGSDAVEARVSDDGTDGADGPDATSDDARDT